MKRNILITSAGKRVELLMEFQREFKRLFPEAMVMATDMHPEMSPACLTADKYFAVPRVTEPGYTDLLLDICVKNDIGLVIPTIDTELAILAEVRDMFESRGVFISVPDSKFIGVCRDKRRTMRFFDEKGISYPRPMDKHGNRFPMFAKPYDGSLSTNIHVITCAEELTPAVLNDPKLMFMELVDKKVYKEFTVDMYYNREGAVRSIVPRERIEIRSGEINKGITRKNDIVGFLHERLASIEGVRGCICLQLFFDEKSGDILGIEINPRFGGGYPLSYYAGANFPRMLIEEYMLQESPRYSDDWRNNTLMLRYDSQVISYD